MKTVLITGASSGIGKACTEKFAENGYSIIGVGNNKKRLEKMKTTAIAKGAKNCIILCYDFSNQKNQMFTTIKRNASTSAYNTLKEDAEVIDNRNDFY